MCKPAAAFVPQATWKWTKECYCKLLEIVAACMQIAQDLTKVEPFIKPFFLSSPFHRIHALQYFS